MRILVVHGSKRGGTAGIASMVGDALRNRGYEVHVAPARGASPDEFDAVVVGGALYAMRWHRDARRFVKHHLSLLRTKPVWFFSSGPLDDSAEAGDISPTRMVQRLMDEVGARGHATFGGRLTSDARGFPAAAMAREKAGDWRDPDHVRAWTLSVVEALRGTTAPSGSR